VTVQLDGGGTGILNTNIIPFRERVSCTIAEACSGTGLSRSKLYEEIGAGRVQTAKIGKRTLVVVPSLLSLLGQPAGSVRADQSELGRGPSANAARMVR
jgi:hypothetical protein